MTQPLVARVLRIERRVALRREPALHARRLDGRGKRLVELRVVLHVDDLVRELVKHHPRDLDFRPADERRQHGVVEVAERRIGGHAADPDVVAGRAEPRRLRARIGFVEVAAVAHAARDREAPLPGRQRQFRRREHVPDDEGAAEVGIPRVARVVRQAEFAARVRADLLHPGEPRLQRGIVRLADDVGDRLRAREDVHLARGALPVVVDRLHRAAAGEGQRCAERKHAPHRQRRRNRASRATPSSSFARSIVYAKRTWRSARCWPKSRPGVIATPQPASTSRQNCSLSAPNAEQSA